MFAGFDPYRTQFINCGSGLRHGQHRVYTDDDFTYLCEGRREEIYVHCGEMGNHPQHRNEDGTPCLGVATPLAQAEHEGTPVVRLTTHEIVSLLEGGNFAVSDSNGNKVVIAPHTADTLLDAHRKECAKVGLEPNLTREKAEELTKGL